MMMSLRGSVRGWVLLSTVLLAAGLAGCGGSSNGAKGTGGHAAGTGGAATDGGSDRGGTGGTAPGSDGGADHGTADGSGDASADRTDGGGVDTGTGSDGSAGAGGTDAGVGGGDGSAATGGSSGSGGSPGSGGVGAGGSSGTGGATGTGGAPGTGGTPGTGGAGTGGAGTGGATGAGGSGVGGASALAFAVSVAANPVVPTGRLLYTISVSNVSTLQVNAVAVTMTLPVGLQIARVADAEPDATCGGAATCIANTQVTWSLGSMAAGTYRTIVVNAQVLGTVGVGDTITTPFALAATGISTVNVTKSVQVASAVSTQLVLGSAINPAVPGQRVRFDVDVGQIGTAPVTGATLQVSLPAGLTFAAASDAGAETAPGQIGWTLGTVAAGSALHRTFDATVAISVAPGATVMPTATLTYDGGLAVDATAEYALAVMASAHPLNVQVTATPDPAVPGGRVLYTVTVGNTSAQAVAAVAVLVRLPIGLQLSRVTDADPDATCGGAATCAAESETSWALGTLPAGGSQTITMNPTVVATAVGDGNLMAASFYVTSNGQNVVQAVKTVSVYSRPQAQLALGTIANPVVPGQAFSLELDVGAMGAAAITGAELSASLPAGLAITAISDGGSQAASGDVVWTIGSLAATAFLHRRIDVTVSATTLVPGMLLGSHATLTYDGGATVDARSQVVIPVIAPPPLLTVAVTGTPNPVALDARLTYTATITNVSAQSIAAVGLLFRIPAAGQFARVTDAQPQASCGGAATCTGNAEATWGFGTMAAGAVQTVTVSELMVGTLLPAGSLITTSTWVTAIGLAAPINVQTTVGAHP